MRFFSILHEERGSVFPLFLFLFMALIPLGMLAIDTGLTLIFRHQIQTVADAGVTAGVMETRGFLVNSSSNPYVTEDLHPENSVREAMSYIQLNIWNLGIDRSTWRSVTSFNVQLLDVETIQATIYGKSKRIFAPILGYDPYLEISVKAKSKLKR
jgi:hypothetical protein